MTQQEVWTVGRLLTWTTDYLKRSGAEGPRLDAEVLLAQARGCQRIQLYAAFEEVVSDEVRAIFRDLVKRRAEGTPVAYLVGRREFYSLPFRVTPDVLIPRPETEFVVIAALDEIKRLGAERELQIADVGTGSGAIAVAIAKHAAHVRVTAIDISPAALAIARENATTHGVTGRIEFVTSDLFASLPVERRFDIIASNPPYIGESELPSLAREVRDHEPRHALIGGPTGSEVIARFIPQAAERLVSGGVLLLEISPQIERDVHSLIASDDRFETPVTSKDLAQLPRVVQTRRK